MLKALVARSLTTVTSALFGILTARLILSEAGVEYFALYSLITTLPSLMLFQDLGTGAALVNVMATSKEPNRDPKVTATLVSVVRIMTGLGLGMLAMGALFLVTGVWSIILGDAGELPNAEFVAFLGIAIWSFYLPLGAWQRILLALNRNHIVVLIQGLGPPVNYLMVWLILITGDSGRIYVALGAYIASFVVATIGMAMAAKALPNTVSNAIRRLPRPRTYPGARVMDVGWPMLAQMVSAPLSISTQRFVLAQSAPTELVAEYTAAAQVYLSFMGVISATGVVRWPRFMARRSDGTLHSGPYKLSVAFSLGVAAIMGLLYLVREPLFAFTTKGAVDVHDSTCLAFSSMLILQGVLYPLGMFIMDKKGIRFQVIPTLTMAIGTVVLAFAMTPSLGVPGPVLSNSLAVLLAQIVPFVIYIQRRRHELWSVSG